MALLRHNSLVKIKQGICPMCPASVGKQPLQAKGLCLNHYNMSLKLKYLNKAIGKENDEDEDFSSLIIDADIIFSQYVRLSAADENGNISCFICNSVNRWQDCDAMHFVPRGNKLLRYDRRNVHAGCKTCNQYLDGNIALYSKRLNEANNGIVEVLLEEGNLVYHFTRDELRSLISEYSIKVKELKKLKRVKYFFS